MKKTCKILMAVIIMLSGAALSPAEKAGTSAEEAKATLLCLNIGKADCLLLSYGETRWLIDTGYEPSYPALEAALTEYQIDHLDGVFLTHCHDDHEGGLMPLAQSSIGVDAWYAASIWFDVDRGKHPMVLAAAKRGREVTWLSAGQRIPVGSDASFSVLGPVKTDEDNENNNSLVLLFSSPAGNILLCGDMKEDEEGDLLDAGSLLPCALLKAGHHGDSKTLSEGFLKTVQPQAAVISTSTAEEPDTPASSVLKKLRKAGCEAYVTQDFQDAVLFTLSGGKVTGVEDIRWSGAPERFRGLTLDIDVEKDTTVLRNSGSESVSLDGYTLFSTKGDEMLRLTGPTLAPGEKWVISGRKSSAKVDQTWNEKRVWSDKKEDRGVLYDPWGRPVACGWNGIGK